MKTIPIHCPKCGHRLIIPVPEWNNVEEVVCEECIKFTKYPFNKYRGRFECRIDDNGVLHIALPDYLRLLEDEVRENERAVREARRWEREGNEPFC